MNAIDTKQKILDGVDANFDAQLAATRDFARFPLPEARNSLSIRAEIDQDHRAVHRGMVRRGGGRHGQ
jgi:hypothetical protein